MRYGGRVTRRTRPSPSPRFASGPSYPIWNVPPGTATSPRAAVFGAARGVGTADASRPLAGAQQELTSSWCRNVGPADDTNRILRGLARIVVEARRPRSRDRQL